MVKSILQRKSIFLAAVVIVIIAVVPIFIPSYWTFILTQVLIMALFATALNMEMGFAGMMPLGQSMFLGLGAYSFSILLLKAGLPFSVSIIIALIVCLIINAIIGFLCLRGKPLTFALLHLSFNILFTVLVAKLISITGGDTGLTGALRPGIFVNNLYFYLLVLAIVIICYVIINRIMHSPFGKVAQGLRENEERLIFLGINTKKYQLILFIICGFFSAVAGILLAMLNKGSFPAYMQLLLSAQAMMMCLIGGAFNFWGPTLGAILIIIFSNVTSNYISYWQGVLGIIMVGTVLGLRGGILKKTKSEVKKIGPLNNLKGTSKRDTKVSPEGTPK